MAKLIVPQILYTTRKLKKNVFKEFKRKVLRETTKNVEKLCFVIPITEGRMILYLYDYE